MKNFFVVTLIISLLFISATSLMAAEKVIKGKIYTIYLDEKTTYVLADLESADFQKMSCLKGTYVGKGEWLKNKVVYIPKDKIDLIIEYDSIDDYKNAMKKVYGP